MDAATLATAVVPRIPGLSLQKFRSLFCSKSLQDCSRKNVVIVAVAICMPLRAASAAPLCLGASATVPALAGRHPVASLLSTSIRSCKPQLTPPHDSFVAEGAAFGRFRSFTAATPPQNPSGFVVATFARPHEPGITTRHVRIPRGSERRCRPQAKRATHSPLAKLNCKTD